MAVRISVGKPKWNLGYDIYDEIRELEPFGLMNEHDHENFKRLYFKRLDNFGVDRIKSKIDAIRKIADGMEKDVVLLCYEDVRKENVWCHRLVFAEWWEEKTGEKIYELADYSPVSETKKIENLQIALF